MVAKTLIAGLLAAVASVSIPSSAPATDIQRDLFFEETAEAFWEVPHPCDDGSTVQATLETTVNNPGSIRKQREAIAVGRVTFDGAVLVNGLNNHSTRPAPFIRVDLEF